MTAAVSSASRDRSGDSARARPAVSGLSGLYDPRSVAIVGASADPAKWGHWLATGALAGADRRDVHLVNRSGGRVLGRACVTALSDLPEAPEVVVVATPPATAGAVVRAAADAGSRYIVAVTAGMAEDEAALATFVRERGSRLLGPNCMGLVDQSSALQLSWGDFPVGSVGLVSQSGNLGLEIGALLARAGLGFSRFVSVGNQRDIAAVELLEDLVRHEPTRVIALYLEQIGDGRRLVAAMAAAREAGKPVLLLTSGASAASQRAVLSHTGALVSGVAAVQAACAAAGALRLSSPGELVDAVAAFLAPALPTGPRVAIVGDSGGQGALGADVFAAAGLAVPELGPATTAQLAALLPAHAASQNPVDLTGAGEADLTSYASVAEVLLRAEEVDALVLTGYFGDYATGTPSLGAEETAVAEALAAASAEAGRALVVHTMAGETSAVAALRRGGVPVFGRIEQAARALANAAIWARAVPYDVAEVDGGAARLSEDGYLAARSLATEYGVRFPAARVVRSLAEAADAATDLGYPVVLKATGVTHKTEAGGVALGIGDASALREAFTAMHDRLAAAAYTVEQMVVDRHAVELIVGVRNDPAFGPLVLVGAGGVTAELDPDTALALAPVTPSRAADLIRTLRCARLLDGWRGAPPVDMAALAHLVTAVSRLAAAHPELDDFELNPVLAGPSGALALDAHCVLRPGTSSPRTAEGAS